MCIQRHGSWLLDLLISRKACLYLLMAAAILGVSSHMISGFGHDIFDDDAYYYTVIAKNFVQSGRSTFDGLSETNGYHPLMFWTQVLISAILGTSVKPIWHYYVLNSFYAITLLASVGLFIHAFRRIVQTSSGFVISYVLVSSISICFLFKNIRIFYSGMESTLALPLCVFILLFVCLRKFTLAGFTGALLVAARLDTFLYILLPLVLSCGVAEWKEHNQYQNVIETLIKLIFPATGFLLIYLLFNFVYFDALMPISGTLKSSFPMVNIQFYNMFGQIPIISLLTAVVGGGLLLITNRIRGWSRHMGFAIVLVTVAQLAGFVLFQKWAKPLPPWYLGLPLFTGVTSLMFGIANCLTVNGLRIATFCCAFLVTLGNAASFIKTSISVFKDDRFEIGTATELVAAINSLPENVIWAYTDCGRLAFWSGRDFINLDGLVNNLDFQDRLRQQELGIYLKENNVRFLVAGIWDQKQTLDREYEPMYKYRVAPDVFSGNYEFLAFYSFSYLYNTYSEKLILPKAAEIWRSSEFLDGKANARFVVYDLDMAGADWTMGSGAHHN